MLGVFNPDNVLIILLLTGLPMARSHVAEGWCSCAEAGQYLQLWIVISATDHFIWVLWFRDPHHRGQKPGGPGKLQRGGQAYRYSNIQWSSPSLFQTEKGLELSLTRYLISYVNGLLNVSLRDQAACEANWNLHNMKKMARVSTHK